MTNVDLFETPVASKKIREGIWAHQYHNGTINIEGMKYVMYSMTESIKRWRNKNKLRL